MMPAVRSLLNHVHRNLGLKEAQDVSDGQLLERYLSTRDEAAFELLVWRHERLVYGVCRRVLRDHHAAEDAFQATFLTLARKASSIGRRPALAGWLHQVAFRIALRASQRQAPVNGVDWEQLACDADPTAAVLWRDLAPVLDQAVNRLPEKLRVPVVLCYLEGKTYSEAARQLECPKGTLSIRLTQARSRLQQQLTRRGVTLSAAGLASLLVSQAASAGPPVSLASRTVLAVLAALRDTGLSLPVHSMTKGALPTMGFTKTKLLLTCLFLAGFLTVGMLASQGLATPPTPPSQGEETARDQPPVKPLTGLPDTPVVNGAAANKVAEYLERLADRGHGGVILIAKGDEILLHKGFGLADRESKQPWTTSHVSTIGSITKQFTATAILKLEMMGKLSVNDPISKHFDNVPTDKESITIHHLLTHTAGLVDVLGGDFDLKATKEWVLRNALQSKLLTKPGERFRYSNLGYSLLGMIVEKASGQPYEDFVQEQLFKPAGMTQTGYLAPKFAKETVAVGYQQDKRWGTVLHHPWLPDGPCWNLRANGCIHATAADMHKWVRVIHASDKVLSPAAKKKMFTAYANDYGYGWDVHQDRKGRNLIEHNGGNGILFADLKYYPDTQLLVFMMTNQSNFSAEAATPVITRIMHGEEYALPPKVKSTTISTEALRAATGRYRLPGGGVFLVRTEGKLWSVSVEGQEALELVLPQAREQATTYRQCNAQTTEAIQAMAKSDFATLRKLRGQEQPEKPFAQSWQGLLNRHGPYQSVEILGTAPAWFDEGDPATWIRMRFQQGTELGRLHWTRDGKLLGVSGSRYPAPLTFEAMPQSPTEAVGTHLQLALPDVHLKFEKGTKEPEMQLQIVTPQGKAVAVREK